MEKELQTRIQHKHDTEERWTAQSDFIPKDGEIIIYDADKTNDYARIKIGNGITVIGELPFVNVWDTPTASEVGAMPNVAVTTSDNGKFLRVVNGVWAAATIPNAEEATFGG